MQGLMGIIMLIGVVVSNPIVLVDYINLMRREYGRNVREAVVYSGLLARVVIGGLIVSTLVILVSIPRSL